MAQPKSRVPLALGLTAAGGIGYYLYGAGGSPKAAEKQFEADVAKASAKVQSELPGRGTQAKKQSEAWSIEAGNKVDAAAEQAKANLAKAEGKFDIYKKDLEAKGEQAKADALRKIDQFDATVEKKAAEAKSGLSSWFGGK